VQKKQKATRIVGKLDRLARNVNFVTSLMEAGVDFKAADMPQADKVMIKMYAVMAEWERGQISARTKAALAAAKERGVQLGRMGVVNLTRNIEERQKAADEFASNLAPVVNGFRAQGLSQVKMVDALNRLNIPAARGGQWSRFQLQRVLARIDGAERNTTTNDVATTGA
jgi:DNA invertase Pin-like site-specific DNA recombinase